MRSAATIPNVFLPPPNTQPVCRGLNVTGNIATVNAASPGQSPTYPGYGTGYSTGFPALNYGGSLVPQSALASFIKPGPTGFITEDFQCAGGGNNYYAIDRAAIALCPTPMPA